MNKRLLALYGVKWNPFSPEVPVGALQRTPRVESFCWRVQQLVGKGDFALLTGGVGTGNSATLRVLAGQLSAVRDVQVGALSQPQASIGDFYRELGDLFGVPLRPHNRFGAPRSYVGAGRRISSPPNPIQSCWLIYVERSDMCSEASVSRVGR